MLSKILMFSLFISFGFFSFINSSSQSKTGSEVWTLVAATLADVSLENKVKFATSFIPFIFLDGFSPHFDREHD